MLRCWGCKIRLRFIFVEWILLLFSFFFFSSRNGSGSAVKSNLHSSWKLLNKCFVVCLVHFCWNRKLNFSIWCSSCFLFHHTKTVYIYAIGQSLNGTRMKWFQKHTSWLQKNSIFQCNEFKRIENKFNFSLRKLKIFGIFGTFERHWNSVNGWHPFLRTFWLKSCQSSRKTKMNIFEKN